MELTRKQEEGLRIAVERYHQNESYTVISGYAGTGKSTLIKWIYDNSLVDSYCIANGEKVISDEVLTYLPQELPDSNKTQTIKDILA